MSTICQRTAAAPISWGVSEVPSWGHQMSAKRVYDEMRSLGLCASELGPNGYFANDDTVAREMGACGFSIIAGFVTLRFRFPEGLVDTPTEMHNTFTQLKASGAEMAVLAIMCADVDYESRPRLQGGQWQKVITALDTVMDIAASVGLRTVLHPHFGTYIESTEDARLILEKSRIDLCLDTGHLALAGDDPVLLATVAPKRVKLVHLKDVDATLDASVREGEIPYHEAVTQGLFQPLGKGDVGIEDVIAQLESAGYEGWYVLEQDIALAEEPQPGSGPLLNAKTSLEYLAELDDKLGSEAAQETTPNLGWTRTVA